MQRVVFVHSICFFGMLPLPFLVSSMGSAGEGGGGGGAGSEIACVGINFNVTSLMVYG